MMMLLLGTSFLLVVLGSGSSLAEHSGSKATKGGGGLRALQSTPLVDCAGISTEASCTTDPSNGEFCVWQHGSCALSRPTCPLLTESECISGRNAQLCTWSATTGCDFASADMWGVESLSTETKWHGYFEFGQTHVIRASGESRHAPRLIADREAELLFTPTLEAQPTPSPTTSPTEQIVHEYGLEQLGTVEVKNANATAGNWWPAGYPKATTNLLDPDESTYYIPNAVPDVDIEFDLAGQRRVQGVLLKTWYVCDIKDAIEVGLAPDDGCEDSSGCAMPESGWTWIDAGAIPDGYNTEKLIHVPKLQARYVKIRLRGGWSYYGDSWGLRRLHISGDVDGEAPLTETNNTNVETGVIDGRAYFPGSGEEVRVAAYDSNGVPLGVHRARDPTAIRPILDQALTTETLQPYSLDAWSATLPHTWIREGTELLIGTTDATDLLLHRVTLRGLAAWSEHTLIRGKVSIFGTAEESEALDTYTHSAKRLLDGMYGIMPVSELKWVDIENWHLPYLVQGTSDGPKLVNSEQERRDARMAAGDDLGTPGYEPGWDILKNQLALKFNTANTGRGFAGTAESYGGSSPYASHTGIWMGWAQSVEVDDGDNATENKWVYEDLGQWPNWGAAAWTGWCGMRAGDECGNYLSHELGHSQTMAHFTNGAANNWGIADQYPEDGTYMPDHPWGYDTPSRRFRTWYDVTDGTGKRDPMNGGEPANSETCVGAYTGYHAQKSQNWAERSPVLLSPLTSDVPEDGLYRYSEVNRKYEQIKKGPDFDDMNDKDCGNYCMPPLQVAVPVVTLMGTLGRDDEACQTYPSVRWSSGNTFEMPDPFTPGLPAERYDGGSYYVETHFADGSSEKGLIGVPNLSSLNSNALHIYSFNVAQERRPTRVELYRFMTDSYPFLTEASVVELLHTREIDLPADVATNPLGGIPATWRFGRGWVGESGDVTLDELCISDEDCAAGGSKRLSWRGHGADLSYGSSLPVMASSTTDETHFDVPVVREEDGSAATVRVVASRFFEDGGTTYSLTGSSPSSATSVPPDATHGVVLSVPSSLNSHLSHGTYRTSPSDDFKIWADQSGGTRSADLRVSVDFEILEPTATVDLSGGVQYVSAEEFYAPASGGYFLAVDPDIGPTSGVWRWNANGGSWSGRSTLTVPLYSTCPGGGGEEETVVVASIKAQQKKCGGSPYQMNAGDSANECGHQLVLQLDDPSINPWLHVDAYRECTFATHNRRPVVVNAHRWHNPEGGKIVGTLILNFMVTVPAQTEAPTQSPTNSPTVPPTASPTTLYTEDLQQLGTLEVKTATGEAWPDGFPRDTELLIGDTDSAYYFPNLVPDVDLEFDLEKQRLIRSVYIYTWYVTDINDSIEIGLASDDGCVVDCTMPESGWTWHDFGAFPNAYNSKRTVEINGAARYVKIRLRGGISSYGSNWGLRRLRIYGDVRTALEGITAAPTVSPTTPAPSRSPTTSPTTPSPTKNPTLSPTTPAPSRSPTTSPTTPSPTLSPTTHAPSRSPTTSPTTPSPTTPAPSRSPTNSPSRSPTTSPTTPSPSRSPTQNPTLSPTTLYNENLQLLAGNVQVKTMMGEPWPSGYPKDTSKLMDLTNSEYYIPNTVPNVDIEIDLAKQRLVKSVYIKTWYVTDITDSIEVGLAPDDGCVTDCPMPESGWTWHVFGAFPNGYNSERTVDMQNAPSRYVRIRLRGGISSYGSNWGLRKLRISGDVSTTLTAHTQAPTVSPTTPAPSRSPTTSPTTLTPTKNPTISPTTPAPSLTPTRSPSGSPTNNPTFNPSVSPTTLYNENLQLLAGSVQAKTMMGETWPDGYPKDPAKLLDVSNSEYYVPNAVPDVDIEIDLLSQRVIKSVYIMTWYVTDITDSIAVGLAPDDGCVGVDCTVSESEWTWYDFGAFPNAYNSERTVDMPNVAARYVNIRLRGGISSYSSRWGLRRLRISGDVHA